jgi:hypothetical protein
MASLSLVPHLAIAMRVQIRCRFDGRWVSGFTVSAFEAGPEPSVRVRRVSDSSELPRGFPLDDVRPDD